MWRETTAMRLDDRHFRCDSRANRDHKLPTLWGDNYWVCADGPNESAIHVVEWCDPVDSIFYVAAWRKRWHRSVRQPLLHRENGRPALGALQRRGRGVAGTSTLECMASPHDRCCSDRTPNNPRLGAGAPAKSHRYGSRLSATRRYYRSGTEG